MAEIDALEAANRQAMLMARKRKGVAKIKRARTLRKWSTVEA